jgi:hypothetical protein
VIPTGFPKELLQEKDQQVTPAALKRDLPICSMDLFREERGISGSGFCGEVSPLTTTAWESWDAVHWVLRFLQLWHTSWSY